MAKTLQHSPETMDYKKIDTEALNRLLLDRIQEIELEGLVDHNFRQCHSLKDDAGLSFFLDLIRIFLADVKTEVKNMAKTLKLPVVDYNEMHLQYIKLKGSSSCIGACRIREACTHLGIAIDNKFKDGCFQALIRIKHEYKSLRDKLDSIVKIEQEIVSRPT